MHAPPPQIAPGELRPGRGWFVLAGVIAVVFVTAGIGGFVWGLVTAYNEVRLDKSFDEGETARVRIAGTPFGIYGREEAPGFRASAKCVVTSVYGQSVLVEATDGFTMTVNGVTWSEIYVAHPLEAGQYDVKCESDRTLRFRTGEHPEPARFMGGLLGGIASLVVLPVVGVATAAIIVIVAGVKRGNHRRRLLAERSGRP